MSTFTQQPDIILETEQELRDAIAEPADWRGSGRVPVKSVLSQWLVDLINEYKASGKYPYNTNIQRLAESRLNIAQQADNNSPLSELVYQNQGYARNQRLRAKGFVECTEELLLQAFNEKKYVLLTGDIITTPRMLQTYVYGCPEEQPRVYLFAKGKRKQAYRPIGSPVRIIDKSEKKRMDDEWKAKLATGRITITIGGDD